jgi:uncharacterized protein (TIGR02145 family)
MKRVFFAVCIGSLGLSCSEPRCTSREILVGNVCRNLPRDAGGANRGEVNGDSIDAAAALNDASSILDAHITQPSAETNGADGGNESTTCLTGCGSCRVCVHGACEPVNAGSSDPTVMCDRIADRDTCGADGSCDGAGGCSYRLPVGASCSLTCTGGKRSAWKCSDQHACAPATEEACPALGGGICNAAGSDCVSPCSTDESCSSTHFCCGSGDAALCDVARDARSCVLKLNQGVACSDDRQCLTGHCTDGVCCTSAECVGDCQVCNIPGASLGTCARYDDSDSPTANDAPAGTCGNSPCRGCSASSNDCMNVPRGADWHADCVAEGTSSCGRAGTCDGMGACELYTASTGCDDGNACTYGDHCDGSGACRGTAITCTDDSGACGAKRVCNGTSSCTTTYPGSDVACEDGLFCNGADRCNGSGSCTHVGSPCGATDTCVMCDEAGKTCRNPTSWYDSSHDLTWEIYPSAPTPQITWQAAVDYCESLELCGKSDWRLPTIAELRHLIRGCEATGGVNGCVITSGSWPSTSRNAACEGCAAHMGPNNGCYWPNEIKGNCSLYWSSTTPPDDATIAWLVNYDYGFVDWIDKSITYGVRCVRNGK